MDSDACRSGTSWPSQVGTGISWINGKTNQANRIVNGKRDPLTRFGTTKGRYA